MLVGWLVSFFMCLPCCECLFWSRSQLNRGHEDHGIIKIIEAFASQTSPIYFTLSYPRTL